MPVRAGKCGPPAAGHYQSSNINANGSQPYAVGAFNHCTNLKHKIMSNEKLSNEAQNPPLRKGVVMPSFIDCMNCKHYNGTHDLLSKIKCGWKPTSDELRHRAIEGDIVDCPMPYYGLNWA